jgi:radical SAM superfamily enzyme YgiQ (UPF0313 family)
MRVLLINPGTFDDHGRLFKMAKDFFYGLTLPHLAAFIPARHEVKILDDSVETVDYSVSVDVVMLTAMTNKADRAYQIADGFRSRGVKTVMGGFHASIFPEEALEHVDAVVVGEAEGVMDELIDDLESNRLKQLYKSEARPDLAGFPTPRYDLINPGNYMLPVYPVQVTRGCPVGCRYCSVTNLMGARLRKRPVGEVLRDLSSIGKFLFFVDDNFFIDREYALELCRAMKNMGKIWATQANLSVGMDQELMDAAREAGIIGIYAGIETLDKGTLKAMNKRVNLDLDYGAAIRNLHKNGIAVSASMMFGFDTDTRESVEQTVAFLEEHKVPFLYPYILTPLPGSRLRRELEEAGRILPAPWHWMNGKKVTFQPKNFTPEELEGLFWRSLARFYSLKSAMKKNLMPPRLAPIVFSIFTRRKLKYHLHPLEGFVRDSGFSNIIPLFEKTFSSKLIRELSARARPGR